MSRGESIASSWSWSDLGSSANFPLTLFHLRKIEACIIYDDSVRKVSARKCLEHSIHSVKSRYYYHDYYSD